MSKLNYYCFDCKKSHVRVMDVDFDDAPNPGRCACGGEAKLMGLIGGVIKVWSYDPLTMTAEDNRHMCGMSE